MTQSMSKTDLQLLTILDAIEKIELYTKDFQDADSFYHDQKSFDASMMQFIIIGESISRIDDDYKRTNNSIPWNKIKNFRNIVAHDYFGIDADEIWDIIKTKLVPLKNDIEKLI